MTDIIDMSKDPEARMKEFYKASRIMSWEQLLAYIENQPEVKYLPIYRLKKRISELAKEYPDLKLELRVTRNDGVTWSDIT
jgi:hypothetical protein